jgi:hypothetical protein
VSAAASGPIADWPLAAQGAGVATQFCPEIPVLAFVTGKDDHLGFGSVTW